MNTYTKEHVKSGLFWKSAEMGFGFGINLILKLILAYLLLPEHFGLIGMSLVFIVMIAEYTDLGLGAALIQRNDNELKPIHWSSIFWCNLFTSWVGFIIIAFGLSRLAAIYYGEEILYYLVIGLSLNLIWSPFIFIHRIKLNKAMNFKSIFIIQTSGVIIGGIVGISMAYSGFGVWSLVGQTLSGSLVILPVAWLLISWKPSFNFDLSAVKELFSFGMYDILLRMVGFANMHLNILLLGGFFNPIIVGYFVFARTFTIGLYKPINSLFKKVYFPFFSNIQGDRDRIKKYYLTQIKYTTALLHPINVGLILIAPSFISLIWGEKWIDSIYPLKFLAVFTSLMAVGGEIGPILKGAGNIQGLFYVHIIRFIIIKIPLVIVGALFYGFEGFMISLILSQIIIFFINYIFVKDYINLKFSLLLKSNLGALIGALIMGGAIYSLLAIFPQRDFSFLILFSIIGIIIYTFTYYLLSNISKLSNYLIPINYWFLKERNYM